MDYQSLNTRLPVSRETFSACETYVELLQKWQKKINLVSNSTLDEIWTRHIIDSLQLAPVILNETHALDSLIVDLGSGAGLPPLILSAFGFTQVHAIESDQRKCIFMQEAKRQCNLTTIIHNQRIEKCDELSADVITARACASILQLLQWASHLMKKDTICCFPKGKTYAKELEEAETQFCFTWNTLPSISHEEGVIVILKDIKER